MDDPGFTKVYSYLKLKIANGVYKAGEKLPEPDELSLEIDAPVLSVIQALDALEQEGYLVQKEEPGLFVSLKERSPGHILIVEDLPQARELLKEIISSRGYSVVTARDGREAISAVRKNSFDLVFLDLRLPEINGVEVFKKVREISPDIPVVIISSHPEDLLSGQSKSAWPEMVISKPFKLSQIREALNLIKPKK